MTTNTSNIAGYNEACKALEANTKPRSRRLGELESYVAGTQYKGLDDFFSDRKPLWERAPCIVYPIVKTAIDSNGDLLLGGQRFPDVTFAGLSGEEAEGAEDAVDSIIKQSRLKAAAREAFSNGQGCGSACGIFGLRGGRLFIDMTQARWCFPELAADGSTMALEIRQPYLKIVTVEGNLKWACYIYRRVITTTQDIPYKPALAEEDGREPRWVEDTDKITNHGLGYCPVVWFPHLKGCEAHDEFDGHAIHEHLTDEIRAHDFALSQRHRAALYCGDPQWTEIGVSPGYNPTGAVRTAVVPASLTGMPGEKAHAQYVTGGGRVSKARKKTPGAVWQYEGKAQEVKVQLHTLPGDALKALDDHARDLRNKLAESLGVVFLDAVDLPNESRLSGRALESFKARQLDRVDYYRSDFGDRFLLPALGMLIRIALDKNLPIEGLDVVRRQIAKLKDNWSWHFPTLELVWGDYFRPSGEEEYQMVQAAALAIEGGFATRRIIVEKLRTVLGIQDVDSYMTELDAEVEENQAREEKMLQAEAKATAAARPKPAGGAK